MLDLWLLGLISIFVKLGARFVMHRNLGNVCSVIWDFI